MQQQAESAAVDPTPAEVGQLQLAGQHRRLAKSKQPVAAPKRLHQLMPHRDGRSEVHLLDPSRPIRVQQMRNLLRPDGHLQALIARARVDGVL